MAATLVSLSPPCLSEDAPMLVSASRPVALRAGSAEPSRTLSDSMAVAISSAQVYFFFGQPRVLAAEGTMARATGEVATESPGVTGTASPVPFARLSHRSESGSHIW